MVWTDPSAYRPYSGPEAKYTRLRASSLTLRGDRIMVLTDRACVYVDWEGNLLFSYPLDGGD